MTEKVLLNSGYNKNELDLVAATNALFKIHRASVAFKNIVFSTQYDSVSSSVYLLHPIELRERSLVLMDVEFRTEGTVLFAETMFNWQMERILIDTYRNFRVFNIDICKS